LPRALGGGGRADNISREAIRHLLAIGLFTDLACDKLGGRIAEPGRKPTVGRVNVLRATEAINAREISPSPSNGGTSGRGE